MSRHSTALHISKRGIPWVHLLYEQYQIQVEDQPTGKLFGNCSSQASCLLTKLNMHHEVKSNYFSEQ